MPETKSPLEAGPRRSTHIAAAALFIVVSVWLTWPLLPRLSTALNPSADPLLNLWALGWSFHILPTDPLSLFDANIFHPRADTLAYSEHLFGITILVWPVYLLSGNLVLAYNTAILASFVLSGFGMYLLGREISGSSFGGLAAGIVYLAVPYRFLHLVHIQLLSYQWFPFVFWCLFRYLREGRPRQLAGIVVFSLLQILSCNYYAVYLAWAILMTGIVVVLFGTKLLSARKIAGLALGAAVVAVSTLPFLIPYLRNQREQGFYRRYEDVVHFSAAPLDYLRPSAFNRAVHMQRLPPQIQSEKALFPGAGALALGGLGVVFGWRRIQGDLLRRTAFMSLALVAVSGVVLSFGPELRWGDSVWNLPYRFLYRHVPGFSGMRVPARAAVLFLLGSSGFVAWGAASFVSRCGRHGGVAGAALVLCIAFEYQTHSLARILPPAPEIPAVDRWLGEEADTGAVLVLPIHEGEAIAKESVNMYNSTPHFRPLVNGFSGWWPNDYWETVGRLRHFPTARILRFLEDRAPVRWVVIHYDAFPAARRRQLEDAMHRYRERMPIRARFGNDAVYELVPEGSR